MLSAGTESPQGQEGEGDTTDGGVASGSGDSEPSETLYENARKFWRKLPADTKRELAHQEITNLQTDKQFQMYLKALSKYENCLSDNIPSLT